MTHHLDARINEFVRQEIERFAEWCGKNWTISQEVFRSDNVFDSLPDGYREGYNTALENLSEAISHYLDEGAP